MGVGVGVRVGVAVAVAVGVDVYVAVCLGVGVVVEVGVITSATDLADSVSAVQPVARRLHQHLTKARKRRRLGKTVCI